MPGRHCWGETPKLLEFRAETPQEILTDLATYIADNDPIEVFISLSGPSMDEYGWVALATFTV